MNRCLTLAVASILLAGCASHSPKPTPAAPVASTKPTTSVASLPFENEIEAFEAADKASPMPKNAIMFYGSSSIQKWKTLAADFPGLPVVNRGFGGSQMNQAVMYLDRVVVPNHPKTLVVYEGDNDLAAGRSVATVIADYQQFIQQVHAKLPTTKIIFLGVKPSPSRANLISEGNAVNAWIKSTTARSSFMSYVDIATPMLGPDGQPRPELFGPDRLHMNATGYALWTSILTPVLK